MEEDKENEDIKILEKMITNFYELKGNEYKINDLYCQFKYKHFRALQNLIARYKELEKENENLRDTNKKLYEMGQRQAMQILIEDDYIPKSKVKEKIEEINNEKLNYSEDEYYLENEIKGYAIDKIHELLEED